MSRVTLTVWRDAQTDPPGHPGGVLTDQGLAWYGRTPKGDGPWYSELGAYGSPPLDPQPSVWCDPQPPGENALTVEHINHAIEVLEAGDTDYLPGEEDLEAAARLRAALEALK